MASTRATPTVDAMWRIGEYFSNGGSAAGLPGVIDPLDPVTGKCQPNYHLMSTDGYANQAPVAYKTKLGDTIGNRDLTVPGMLPGPIDGFVPGGPFPPPYREGPTATSNTMADVAMYYWINDLRPELPNTGKDSVAPWQKVNFYGLAIGAEGSLPHDLATKDGLEKGSIDWPPAKNNTPTSIDDLWHAAVNSRGTYYNAQNAQELAESIASALGDFTDQAGTGAAVGMAGAQLTATTSFGYRTSYDVGWWGDVKKYALNPATGAIDVDKDGIPLSPPVWTAAAQLDAQVAGDGWKSGKNRRIVTINDSGKVPVPVPFAFDKLSADQQKSLNAGWLPPKPKAEAVLDFLRGDQSNEGVGTTHFRIRSHVLGDFVNSGAVPVGAPSRPYDDAGNPGYPDFAKKSRRVRRWLYVGGNDGMVHALDDSSTADAGKESWAFGARGDVQGKQPEFDGAHSDARVPDRGARLSSRRDSAFRSQVSRQRPAADLGHRFREHQHQDAAKVGQRLAYDSRRRSRRRRPRRLRARRHDAGPGGRLRSGYRVLRSRAVGGQQRHPQIRQPWLCFRRSDARQDLPLRLGRLDRVRLQQQERQRVPLRRQSNGRKVA